MVGETQLDSLFGIGIHILLAGHVQQVLASFLQLLQATGIILFCGLRALLRNEF